MNNEIKSAEKTLEELFDVVKSRKKTFAEGSYTCYLFEKGLDKILKKCGEECSEMIIAAKSFEAASPCEKKSKKEEIENEICDLIYHMVVLMVNEGVELDNINAILDERSKKIGNLKVFKKSDHNS